MAIKKIKAMSAYGVKSKNPIDPQMVHCPVCNASPGLPCIGYNQHWARISQAIRARHSN